MVDLVQVRERSRVDILGEIGRGRCSSGRGLIQMSVKDEVSGELGVKSSRFFAYC